MNDSHQPGTYTAAQIARALDKSKRYVLSLLEHIEPSSVRESSGNLAKAWSFSSLPVKLQERLEDAAKSQGYRNAEHLLSAKPEQWQPPVPMSEVAEHCLDKAVRLRESLRRVLAKRDVPYSEVEQLGMEDYKRHFGHGITSRHLRALVDRTLARDN